MVLRVATPTAATQMILPTDRVSATAAEASANTVVDTVGEA
jgi:hypothetical protein